MKFPDKYAVLNQQSFCNERFSIVPIRYEDRFKIMEWRNEQIYHLRQTKRLTIQEQEIYYNNVVSNLFNENQPNQILFSYLENEECIGYGGLVHINWIDSNAEISFVLKTELEQNKFEMHWGSYLELIEKVAFEDLLLHKLYTYAFDVRPHLYTALEKKGYKKEAILKEHCLFNAHYKDVVIHSKINEKTFFLKEAIKEHEKLLFDWANDQKVRANSLSNEPIKWENHVNWFASKMNNPNTRIFIFYMDSLPIGQIRLDLIDEKWLIDYSIDKEFRGLGYGTKMLKKVIGQNGFNKFIAKVKEKNISSARIFEKIGFTKICSDQYNGEKLIKFQLNK